MSEENQSPNDLSESKPSSPPIPELQKYLRFFDKESSRKFFSKQYHVAFHDQFEFACDFFKAFVNGDSLPEIPAVFKALNSERWGGLVDHSIFEQQDKSGKKKSREQRVYDLFFNFNNWDERALKFQQCCRVTHGLSQHTAVVEELLNVLAHYTKSGLSNIIPSSSIITSFQWPVETTETLSPAELKTITTSDNTRRETGSIVHNEAPQPPEQPENSLSHPQQTSEISKTPWGKIFWATLIAELVIFAVPLTVAGFAELTTKAKHLENVPNLNATDIKDFFFGSSKGTIGTSIGISLAVLLLVILFIKAVFHHRPEEHISNECSLRF